MIWASPSIYPESILDNKGIKEILAGWVVSISIKLHPQSPQSFQLGGRNLAGRGLEFSKKKTSYLNSGQKVRVCAIDRDTE